MRSIDRSIEGLFDNLDVSFPRKLILRVIFLRESVYALFYQFS